MGGRVVAVPLKELLGVDAVLIPSLGNASIEVRLWPPSTPATATKGGTRPATPRIGPFDGELDIWPAPEIGPADDGQRSEYFFLNTSNMLGVAELVISANAKAAPASRLAGASAGANLSKL
jgi:hypothetical protein